MYGKPCKHKVNIDYDERIWTEKRPHTSQLAIIVIDAGIFPVTNKSPDGDWLSRRRLTVCLVGVVVGTLGPAVTPEVTVHTSAVTARDEISWEQTQRHHVKDWPRALEKKDTWEVASKRCTLQYVLEQWNI